MGSNWSPDVYIKTYRYAAKAHWNSETKQLVPGTDLPYRMHFSMVAMEVIAALGKESGLVWTETLLSSALCFMTRLKTPIPSIISWSRHSGL